MNKDIYNFDPVISIVPDKTKTTEDVEKIKKSIAYWNKVGKKNLTKYGRDNLSQLKVTLSWLENKIIKEIK